MKVYKKEMNLKSSIKESNDHNKLDLSFNTRESKIRGLNKKVRIAQKSNIVLLNAAQNSLKRSNFLPPLPTNNNISNLQKIEGKLDLHTQKQTLTFRSLPKYPSNLNVFESEKDRMSLRENHKSGSRDVVKESNYSRLIEENSKKLLEFNQANKNGVIESENLWKMLIDSSCDQNKSSYNLNSTKSIDSKDQEMKKIHEISNINLGARWELISANKQLLDFDIVLLLRSTIDFLKGIPRKCLIGLKFIKMYQKTSLKILHYFFGIII